MSEVLSQLEPELIQELSELPWLGADFRLDTINAGAVNCNYRLRSGQGDFFLKIFSAELAVNLNRQQSFALQGVLHQKGVAIEPVYLARQGNFQLDVWCDDLPLTRSSKPAEQKSQLMANMLAHLHQLEVPAPVLDLPSQWQHYLDCMLPQHCPFSSLELAHKLNEYGQIWQRADKHCFCHHDLSPCHVLTGQAVTVIDWEYAAYSNPWFDLASSIELNQFSARESREFIQFYCAQTGDDWHQVVKDVQTMLPLIQFTNLLWYATTASQ